MPLGLRKFSRAGLWIWSAERGRSDCLGQDAQARAFSGAVIITRAAHSSEEQMPSPMRPFIRHRLCAVRVVKRQYRSLREYIGRAQAGWVIRIAFDLGRPAHVAFHQQARATPPMGMAVA